MNIDDIMRMHATPLDDAPPPSPEVIAQTLRDALTAYDQQHDFTRGQLLSQKSGLAKYTYPDPIIFVRYLDPLRLPFVEAGGGEGREHDGEVADCVVGVRGADGTMMLVTAVAARFEPWKETS